MADTQAHGTQSARTLRTKTRLLRDHLALKQLLTQLTDALEGGDSAAIGEVWTQFERCLRDHIETEERCLFPLHAATRGTEGTEIESLKFEHQHILRTLDELGNLVDLHALRKASVDELSRYLLKHAAGEECSLYR